MNLNGLKYGKILSWATAAAVALSMTAAPAFAAEKDTVNIKDETVYVITEADGSQSDIIVSDHLKNREGLKVLEDVSSLKDIENVKGDEKFSKENGDSLSWNADGEDIYYQGNTDKKPPVTIKVKYYLNDKEIEGKNLEGKSGRVKIVIDYDNNTAGAGGAVKVPFVAMTGMIIEDDSFKNAEVSSGKVIDDGEKQFILGMAVPGMSESLGVSEEKLGFGDRVEITGDADKFKAEDLMSIVTNDFFDDIDTKDLEGLDMDSQIKALDKGAKQLVSGSNELYRGIDTLNNGSEALSAGVGALNTGSKQLKKGTEETLRGSKKLADGSTALSSGLSDSLSGMKQGVGKLNAGSKALYDGLAQIQAGVNGDTGLANGARALADGIGQTKDAVKESAALDQQALIYLQMLKENDKLDLSDEEYRKLTQFIGGSKQYADGVAEKLSGEGQIGAGANSLFSGIGQIAGALNGSGTSENPGLVAGAKSIYDGTLKLSGGLEQATADSDSLTSGAKELADGAKQLLKGESQVNGGAAELAAGMSKLDEKSGELITGVNKLSVGSKALNIGMEQFYRDGIEKIVNLYNDTIKDGVGNLDEMVRAGKDYDTFTNLPEGMKGTVKFVYRTEISGEDSE